MGEEKNANKGNRLYFLDNLRTFIIFLVVLFHVGGIYESTGVWASFWIVDDPISHDLPDLINLILDIFMMAIMFFISGYFTPPSLKNKDNWSFLKGKFRRLMIPWIIAALTIIPLYKVIFLASRNLPQENWLTYFHFSNGFNIQSGQSWLWFLPLLFAFNVVYLFFSKAKISIPNISLKGTISGIFLIGWIYSASMDIFGLQGWTLTGLIDFQNERLLIYFMFFLLGSLCFKLKIFDAKPENNKLYSTAKWLFWLPIIIYIVFLVYPIVNPDSFIVSEIIDKVIAWFFYQISLFTIVYILIEFFRRHQDKQGKLRKELSKNSYYVYIIHIIVLGSLALFTLNISIPVLLKYLIVTISAFVVSNLIISFSNRASPYIPIGRATS